MVLSRAVSRSLPLIVNIYICKIQTIMLFKIQKAHLLKSPCKVKQGYGRANHTDSAAFPGKEGRLNILKILLITHSDGHKGFF